ncbi:MAG TPA: hypothetical protein VGI54_00925 [Solirubrobacteraceae bacterium]
MSKGPLGVRWGDWTLDGPQAGALTTARLDLENAGSVAWRDGIFLSYHWLDDRGNPIVWDGERTVLPAAAPGERVTVEARVRGPIPPGRYRLAFDLVAEFRAWFSELGSDTAAADVDVGPRVGPHAADLPSWVEPAPDWDERVAAAHAEGYGVVAGTIEWNGGWRRPRPKALTPYAPGRGRVPGFSQPLLCPSVMDGILLDPLPDVAGLPAFAAPTREPWLYDGLVVLRADPRRR